MSEQIVLGAGTTLRVLSHDEGTLELEATYAGGSSAPPPHLHPAQDERFEVRAGVMSALIGGEPRSIAVGEVLEIPRGTVHQMWNEGEREAVVNWRTSPSGRTLEWFRELAATLRGEGREDPSTLLADYADVFVLITE
jgi:mannose-6-phosphate isomerase-like protein (cupin superfamily)